MSRYIIIPIEQIDKTMVFDIHEVQGVLTNRIARCDNRQWALKIAEMLNASPQR